MRKHFLPIFIFIVLPLLCFWPITTGQATFAGFDHSGINQPFKEFAFGQLSRGNWPAWCPYLDCGTPFIAEGEAGIFFPLNWLLLLPGDFLYKYNLVILLSIALAGISMYILLRSLGCRIVTATAFALLFEFSFAVGFQKANCNVLQAFALAPALIAAFSHTWRRWWAGGIITGVVLLLILAAGAGQYFVYSIIALVVWALVDSVAKRDGKITGQYFVKLIIAAIVVVIIGWPQLAATSRLVGLSERSVMAQPDLSSRGLWLNFTRLFATFVFPAFNLNRDDFFAHTMTTVYLGPLCFLLYLIAGFRRRSGLPAVSATLFWSGIIFLLLAMGDNFPLNKPLMHFSILNKFANHARFSNYFLLFGLAAAALVYEGLRTMEFKGHRIGEVPIPELVVMFIILLPFVVNYSLYIPTKFALFIFLILMIPSIPGLIAKRITRTLALGAALGMALLCQLIMTTLLASPTVMWRADYDKSGDNLRRIAEHGGEFPSVYVVGVQGAQDWLFKQISEKGLGAFSFRPRNFIPVLTAANRGMGYSLFIMNADFPLELSDWEKAFHKEPQSPALSGLFDETGVNFVMSYESTLNLPGFELTKQVNAERDKFGYYLYERVDKINRYEFKPDDPGEFEVKFTPGNDLKTYQIEVSSEQPGLLIVRDQYYPGWKVWIDGVPAEFEKVRYFKAVRVQGGEHSVVMKYEPGFPDLF